MLASVLEEAGFKVVTVADGQAGFDAIVSKRPDLVICDILLPRLSGFEILERLSWVPTETGSAVPFIFLTASTTATPFSRAAAWGPTTI